MKLALVSDIHANLEALQATLDDIALQAVDRIVCLGDIVGYNTKPAECIALLRRRNALCIAGNHDCAVSGRITTADFSRTAMRAVAWTRARLIRDDIAFLGTLPFKVGIDGALIAVHGALHPESGCETVRLDNDARRMMSVQALMAHPSGARICAYGHTHRAAVYEYRDRHLRLRAESEVRLQDDAYYLINPGTVGAPRTSDHRASYMILDLARRTVMLRHVAYDAAVPFAATRQAGLAPRFAFIAEPMRGAMARGLRTLLELPRSLLRDAGAVRGSGLHDYGK